MVITNQRMTKKIKIDKTSLSLFLSLWSWEYTGTYENEKNAFYYETFTFVSKTLLLNFFNQFHKRVLSAWRVKHIHNYM